MTGPMDICISALRALGVPDRILDSLVPGVITDAWVQLVVMDKLPWPDVEKRFLCAYHARGHFPPWETE